MRAWLDHVVQQPASVWPLRMPVFEYSGWWEPLVFVCCTWCMAHEPGSFALDLLDVTGEDELQELTD